jgi:hypothetical protein
VSAVGRKLGRGPVRHDARTLLFAAYLDDQALPPPPPARDWTHAAAPDWGMMQNDRIGDCTCAAAAHAIQVWSANHSTEITLVDGDVVAAYAAITGYKPDDPTTDNGAVELDVLRFWGSTGIGGHKISAYAALEHANRTHVESAINLFGCAYIGAALPLSAQSQTVWDVAAPNQHTADYAPGSWGGHAMIAVAYSRVGVLLVTWGALKLVTWEWWLTYVEEAYAVLGPEWADDQAVAPNGFDLAALRADLVALRA